MRSDSHHPLAFFLVFLLIPLQGNAFDGKRVEWLCWYDSQRAVRCMPKQQSLERLDPAAPVEVRKIDPRLPGIADTLWNHPETLSRRIITIPLLSEPLDADSAGRLAVSVVCGSNVNCSADFFDSAEAPGLDLALKAAYGDVRQADGEQP